MRALKAVVLRNLLNFVRDKMRLGLSVFMSGFFLFVFSFVTKSAMAGFAQPLNYLVAGVIIMTVFQSALTNSTGTIDDIATGFMKEVIVAPIARWQISIGQVLSSTIIAVLQGLLVIVFGLFLGLRLGAVQLVEMAGVMVVVGLTFASMGLYLATLAKSSATFQVMIMVLMMPLTFLSGAYIPTTVMPAIVRPLVYLNPLTYTTSIFRFITLGMWHLPTAALLKAGVAFDLYGAFTITPYAGLCIVAAMGALFFALCVRKFGGADFSNVKVFDHHAK